MWWGLDGQAGYEHEARYQSADYAKRAAEQKRQSCGRLLTPERTLCIKAAEEEYRLQRRDNEREYQDLAAQRTSALWTGIMGVAALIGMGLSAIGVALVYTTFNETRITNSIARDTARRQLRAYVSIDEVNIFGLVAGQKARCSLNIRNNGATPAYRVNINSTIRACVTDADTFRIFFDDPLDSASTSDLGPSQFFTHNNWTEGELTADQADFLRNGDIVLIFAGVIGYRDAFGRRHRMVFKYSLDRTTINWDAGVGATHMQQGQPLQLATR